MDPARTMPTDDETRLAALQATLWSGDEALRREAEKQFLDQSDDRMGTLSQLWSFYRNELRYDLSLAALWQLRDAMPKDPSLTTRSLDTALCSGRKDLIDVTIKAVLAEATNPRQAEIDIVSTAADQLAVDTVEDHLPAVLNGQPDQAAANALLATARLWWRMARPTEAARAVESALHLAIDRAAIWSSFAQLVLTAPEVPFGALEQAMALAQPGDRVDRIPYVIAARCLPTATTPAALKVCLDAMHRTRFLEDRILLATANKAMATKDYALAQRLFEAALQHDSSRNVKELVTGRIAAEAAVALSPVPAELARLATFGLGLLPAQDYSGWQMGIELRASLTQLASSPEAALSLLEAGIARAPANPSLRNHVAYILSVTGLDTNRALREVEHALDLASPDSFGAYLDTQAWALYKAGHTRDALAIEEIAARFWQADQTMGLAESYLHLGMIFEQQNRMSEAREAYRKAILMGPAEPGVSEALARWQALIQKSRKSSL